MKLLRYILSVLFSSIILAGCAKFVDAPPPPNSLVPATVFSTDATAAAAVTNMYQSMVATSLGGGLNGISALSGLSADEITLQFSNSYNALQADLYSNSLTAQNSNPPYWQDLYSRIYQANSVIEGITASTGISEPRKKQLIGEAKFIRAFSNFYLVNFYGDVPLATTTDYIKNQLLARTPAAEIYQHIIADLSDAQSKLNSDYLTASGTVSTGRVRVNKSVATAMLARVYLYTGKYDSAELAATSVISNSAYQLPSDLDSVFLANNNEAIWQLEAPNYGTNTADIIFNLKLFGGPNANTPLVLNKELAYQFETSDNRKIHWTDSVVVDGITYYFPYKYKLFYTGQPATEYATLFRLAEQYLIRTEARAMQNNITGAQADLNAIRHRAGLPDTDAANQADLLTAVLNERRFELFTENGHRWLDLKRTGKIDEVMTVATAIKGGTWNSYQQLYPIPLSEIKLDNKLTQNQGY